MKFVFLCLVVLAVVALDAKPTTTDNDHMHAKAQTSKRCKRKSSSCSDCENIATYWREKAQVTLYEKLNEQANKNIAKNVILFLGDGMSIPTLAAARAYLGQLNGHPGEETVLSFEAFPYTALSKTYCVDAQVADSACSATAYLCGTKANIGTIGVDGRVTQGDWQQGINDTNKVSSIASWSQLVNKRTGIVTTTRVTHASPSGAYANTADRDWECDADLINSRVDPEIVDDIAKQLITGKTGSAFNVILGGGRGKMLPHDIVDEEGSKGERLDGLNLIETWKHLHQEKSEYVWNRDQLLNVNSQTDYLLGLFESSHCKYNLERDSKEPTLKEMVEAAIKVLAKGKQGFFLFVEGGRIDHAHHDTKAQKALDETVEFAKAIQQAYEMTNPEETLIVVTSDHAHTMSVSGYPDRGNDILGIAGFADDNLPYATLTYANGPGYTPEENNQRHDLRKDDTHALDYEFPAIAPLSSETHGGDDVGIFATGPWAHLFRGTIEQNVIPHIMAYASCVGDVMTACGSKKHPF